MPTNGHQWAGTYVHWLGNLHYTNLSKTVVAIVETILPSIKNTSMYPEKCFLQNTEYGLSVSWSVLLRTSRNSGVRRKSLLVMQKTRIGRWHVNQVTSKIMMFLLSWCWFYICNVVVAAYVGMDSSAIIYHVHLH